MVKCKHRPRNVGTWPKEEETTGNWRREGSRTTTGGGLTSAELVTIKGRGQPIFGTFGRRTFGTYS